MMKNIRIRSVMSQICVLRSNTTSRVLVVGNTHLFWDPAYHVVSLLHVHALCTKIAHMCASQRGQGENVNVIVCGDMNSKPGSLIHQYLANGFLVKTDDPLVCFLADNVRNPIDLKLARGSPNFTNYTESFKDVIDYILCDSESKVRS